MLLNIFQNFERKPYHKSVVKRQKNAFSEEHLLDGFLVLHYFKSSHDKVPPTFIFCFIISVG